MRIYGKTIWITDAAGPLGSALAVALMRAGNFVIASGTDEYLLKQLYLDSSGAIGVMPMNMGGDNPVQDMRRQLRILTGHLDIVVANASALAVDEHAGLDPELCVRRINADVFGMAGTLDMALPLLQRSRSPYVVWLGADTATHGFTGSHSIEASRAAAEYFALALAEDLRERNIDMSIVRPDVVNRDVKGCDIDRLAVSGGGAKRSVIGRLLVGMEKRKPVIQLAGGSVWLSALAARLAAYRKRQLHGKWHRWGGRIG